MTGRNDTQVVLKYCEVIDEFIKVKVFPDDDPARLVDTAQLTNRRDYQRSVVEASVLDYQENVLPLFKKFNRIYKPEALEDVLYQICVEVNPHLEIHQVSLPLEESEGGTADDAAAVRQRLSEKVCGIERDLMSRVIGQKDAIIAVSKSLKKAAVGLKDPKKPIGVFLLVGSTGSGKTELAKVLTQHLFGKGISNLVRIDCSEFALPHEYAKLIGAPPGYIGHNEGGFLTEAIKNKKSCVVLFDEIEKAHHKIHNLLLQLMDEGTLTDGKGNIVRFDNCLVLLTSNLGVKEIDGVKNRCGFDSARRASLSRREQGDAINEAMRLTFSPEFINRLDDVVLFNTLTEKDCNQIARLQLNEVASYLAATGIEMKFSPRVEAHVAREGFSANYGARELRRVIKSDVESPLAELILSGDFSSGDAVNVSVRRGKIHFEAKRETGRGRKRTALIPTSATE